MEKFSFKKRAKSFVYAWQGMRSLVSREHNAWIHSFATVCVLIAGFAFQITRIEWALVILCIGTVFAAEGFNTAIERMVDFVSPERHPQAGLIKDVAAGAVLFTAIAAAIVGLIVFVPYVRAFIGL